MSSLEWHISTWPVSFIYVPYLIIIGRPYKIEPEEILTCNGLKEKDRFAEEVEKESQR